MAIWSWLSGRGCGVFLHLSALPGGRGIGCFDKCAREFVLFLREAGMKYWQICPLNPTGYGDSPYQSPSTFAGNPYFIDTEELVAHGLLRRCDLPPFEQRQCGRVDFGNLYENIWPTLRIAFENFSEAGSCAEEFENFCETCSWWLDEYAAFMALKNKFAGQSWLTWNAEFSDFHAAKTKISCDEILKKSAQFHKFVQWLFHRQWRALKNFAAENGISIIGDIPIFVGLDSADVWANVEIFKLQRDGSPKVVAGVPPDAFSDDGQVWGNPVYDWTVMENDDFSWWMKRIKRCAELYDVIRLDHFRGFHNYWEIATPVRTGANGKWENAAGIKFFGRVKNIFPRIKLIAEDLGCLDDGVTELLRETGLPGMNVLQFAFDGNRRNKYLPHEHEKNSTLYLGTHDNDTTRGWFHSLPESSRHQIRSYLRVDGSDIAWDLIRKAYESPSNLLILSMQDILNLGSEARFNTPNTNSGNWQWRMTLEQLHCAFDRQVPQYLNSLRDIYGR
ncbi:MAG: 4-alpha-glucanotransferase [Puniceicoccales bacterium]|jgi:4-alpha-glucanotransferase|nr:4-alpha-glucanotransferase [Puniceicoccales bacterium]